MARVTYGALITELAGSIGGITFQKNSSGNIARLKPNMPVNVSEAQQAQNIFLSQLVASWSSLSDANKTSWNDLAVAHDHTNEWGESKTLNGFQWFVSCNLNLLFTSQATIDTAPSWTTPLVVPDFSIITNSTQFIVSWSPPWDTTGYKLVIYATPLLRQSTLKLRKSTFFISYSEGEPLYWRNLLPEYTDLFNLTWADVFSDANCTIIVRIKTIENSTGLASTYTSTLVKIN